MIPLQLLTAGASGRVTQLMGGVEEVRRMEELGLRAGAAVEMVQGGNPCIIRLAGNKVCFRRTDALHVLVEESQ